MIKVTWDQWYRCGKYGDDVDFRTETAEFENFDLVDRFIEDLIEGKYRGYADMKVHRRDIQVTEV